MTTPLMHGIVLEVLAESIEKLSKRYYNIFLFIINKI